MKTKEENDLKSPYVIIDKRLNKNAKSKEPSEQLKRANAFLKKHGIPEAFKQKKEDNS